MPDSVSGQHLDLSWTIVGIQSKSCKHDIITVLDERQFMGPLSRLRCSWALCLHVHDLYLAGKSIVRLAPFSSESAK